MDLIVVEEIECFSVGGQSQVSDGGLGFGGEDGGFVFSCQGVFDERLGVGQVNMLIVVSEDGLGIWLVDVVYKLIISGIEDVG